MQTHLPPQWKQRLMALVNAHGWSTGQFSPEVDKLLTAWAIAEGANSDALKPDWNPLCATLTLPGVTVFNTFVVNGVTYHVWNYARPVDGIAATGMTLANGHYTGILGWMQNPQTSAADCVSAHRAEFSTWGTNPDTILGVLAGL